MAEFFRDPAVVEQLDFFVKNIPTAIWESIYSTVFATFFAYVIGLPLGVILFVGERDGIRPLPQPLMKALNAVINLLRSFPFLILMIVAMPLSRLIMGTTLRTPGILVPLTVAAAPFVARLVEGSLREMDRGLIEAAQAMGCTTFQVIWKVLLPESLPSIATGVTTAFITILGYGAMSGAIGGGGVGSMAQIKGWQARNEVIMYCAVIVLVILVQIFQSIGTRVTVRLDKRTAAGQKKKR